MAALALAKLDAVTNLVDKLTKDMDSLSMAPKERNHALEELKIYGRDPRNADPIFTKEGISMLLSFAFNDKASSDTSRGALRILANSMVLKPETRQMFVDGGYTAKACQRLNTESWDDEFLLARIIFLSTYSQNIKVSPLVTEHGLADSINANLGRHAKLDSPSSWAAAGPMEEMALPETLKLLFNVTYHCPVDASAFSPSIPHIVSLIFNRPMPSTRVLDAPLGPLVNSLLNLDISAESSKAVLFPSTDETKLPSKLVEILDRAMKEYTSNELDATVIPVVDMLSKMYIVGPEAVQTKLRDDLLPTAEDRQNVLGRGSSLSARLLKASTNPIAPKFGPVVSHFFFVMSDRDGSKFVENVGYGYASGYLFQNKVPIPAAANATFDAADETGGQRAVNPITGQFIDREKPDDLPPMTDEEKEREAERLFVLFERLKMNGVLSVQNPVEQAVREGKFRELKDDEVEEVEPPAQIFRFVEAELVSLGFIKMPGLSIRLPFAGASGLKQQGYAAAASDALDESLVMSDILPGQVARPAKISKKATAAKARVNKRQRPSPASRKERSLSASSAEAEDSSAVTESTLLTTPSNNGSATKRKRSEVPHSGSDDELPPPPSKRRGTKEPTRSTSQGPKAATGKDAEEERRGNLWEVERIVGARIEADTYIHWYQVKWKSWSAKHNTWEPKKNLGSCLDLIEDFEMEEAEAAKKLRKQNRSNKQGKK
ncbi:hypothetical protein NLG97_g10163 [Lecanicillium saksenae]|uniref:Uncharacterized protein n=1 Tax=Lecanicillium saksenae TaxID=468837 RepID=A0ACC1QGQ2_9HYPO|nr:hypothetical protein NLG97_g10163 [Lecanicillium saksenae]